MNGQWNHRYGHAMVAALAGLLFARQALLGIGGMFVAGAIAFGAPEKGAPEKGTPDKEAQEKEATPPKGQHYVGKNTCAACHYSMYRVWKHDKHAVGLDILPKKYHGDPKCLVCHTTGYGEPTGYKDASTPQLAGITCESCHGPGSAHAKLAQKLFLGNEANITLEAEKKIRGSIALFLEKHTVESEEAEAQARSSIFRIQPGNACVKCHISKAHRAHPDYDKE